MKVKLENGEVLQAKWVEFWHENNSVLVGVRDDVLHFEQEEIDKIEEK